MIRAYRQFIAVNVRLHRKQLGYSQELLAKIANVDLTYIQRIERGTVNLTVDVLVRLALALETTPDELFKASELEVRKPGRPKKFS